MTLDPNIVTAAGLIGSKEIITKLLGPTAEYLGGELKEWTRKRVENTSRIFAKEQQKLGNRINEPGQVPPKVLKEILEEGSYCDDELASEYFAGVLASSRSEIPRDDRGAVYAQLVSRLSSYQIKGHFIIYSAFKKAFDGRSPSVNLMQENERRKLKLFIPFRTWNEDMALDKEQPPVIVQHVLFGLLSSGLIDPVYDYGPAEYLHSKGYKSATESGMVVTTSILGIELFLWALGNGNIHASLLLLPAIKIEGIEMKSTSKSRSA